MAEATQVRLISAEGEAFEVGLDIVKMSELVKIMVEGVGKFIVSF